MKEYELHVTVSYMAGGDTKHNYFVENIKASNKKEAKAILKEQLKDEGYAKINVEEIYEA